MEPLPGDAVAAQPPWCREIEIKLFQTCQSRSEVGRQFNQTPAPVDSLFPSPGRRCHLRDQGNTGVSDHFPIFYVWTIIRFCSQMWQKLGFFILATTMYALKREQNRITGAVCVQVPSEQRARAQRAPPPLPRHPQLHRGQGAQRQGLLQVTITKNQLKLVKSGQVG